MGIKNLFDPAAFAKAIDQSSYTRKQIAEKTEIGVSDIYRYERGLSTPRMDRLQKLVEILGPSITGLSISTNGQSALQKFSPDERRFLAWFRSLTYYRQCRVLGFCEAVVAFGNDVDAEFAAELTEKLVLEHQKRKEQSG